MENENNVQSTPEEQPSVSISVEGTNVTATASLPPSEPSPGVAGPPVGDVADKFKGLPMRELISAPLIAVCESQQQLAATAFNFYQKIAYEDDGKTTRMLKFELERPVQTPTGISSNKINVNAPFIGLVPIPSLLIEKVDIDFQMEVTDASSSKTTDSAELTTTASAKWFTCSVSVQGKVSSARENTRSSNQTAKYQVHVTAAQQSQTEGLSKLMDIMASCIEPLDGTSK